MAYSDKVIDHYNNPRNVGQMVLALSARLSVATLCVSRSA
jgi:NifU-like protein involved in Fe-S cluster formation